MLTLETASTGRHRWHHDRHSPPWGVDPLALLAVGILVALGEVNLVAIGDTGLAVHQAVAVLGGLALVLVLLRALRKAGADESIDFPR